MHKPTYTLALPSAALAAALLLGAVPAAAAGPMPMPAAMAPATAALLTATGATPAVIASTCASQIALAGKKIDAIVHRRSARTFDTVIAALESVETDLSDNLAAQTFLFQVAADAAVRSASEKCGADVSNFITAETARPDLYAALAAARDSKTAVTPAERKLQSLYLIGAQRSGAALPAAQRKAFIALNAQLTGYANDFAANLSNDPAAITINATQLADLPPDFAAALKTDAAGVTTVPVNESTYGTFMTSETDAGARKAYYIAYQRRGGEKNVALLESAIVARDGVAHLLHYPNWATYIAADRMAGTPARIATFLTNLDAALLPKARTEREQLAAAKGGASFDQWDVPYYQNQLRKSLYSVDRNVIKTYFPAPYVIDSVMHIYSVLLGLTFTAAPDLPRWDPAVLAYRVTDTKGGAYRGAFYLDLYPRPGKFNHFENSGLITRRVEHGIVHPVLNTILGNWPAPAAGKPSLLSHDDVIVFFHEFGHNVAALCANTDYATLNNGFRWDFVEAPSQMLENFVWEPAILKAVSSNVDTGKPLPDDLIAKMIAARHFDDATGTVVQAFYSAVDQRYHTQAPPVATTAVWKDLDLKMTPSQFVDGTFPQAGFNHLMNGYEAQYYGYLWSKVYAQDMFTAFKTGGLENPVVGMRYRNDILAPARSIEPDAEVRAFLGRPMDPSTFYRELGITSAGR